MSDNTKAILRLHSDLDRVMRDGRFDELSRRKGSELRHLIVAYYWARFETKDSDARWKRTLVLAGLTPSKRMGDYSLKRLFEADAPRYEPLTETPWARPLCPEPMVRGPRAGEPCGQSTTSTFKVTDPATGEWHMVGYCTRHKAISEALWRNERQFKGKHPEPTPNTGGLLPGYIRATNWPDIYAASRPGWKPPSIGNNADDWPVLAKVRAHVRPTFTMLDGAGEESDGVLPLLRLVSS